MYILVYMETVLKTKIKKWGNSQGLRISKDFLKFFGLGIDDEVSITKDRESIIIKPIKDKNKKILDSLLNKINDSNRHGEVDWGKPVGREIW